MNKEKIPKKGKRPKKFVSNGKHEDKAEPWQKLYQLVEEKGKWPKS